MLLHKKVLHATERVSVALGHGFGTPKQPASCGLLFGTHVSFTVHTLLSLHEGPVTLHEPQSWRVARQHVLLMTIF
jgi:hypothetical protein